MTNPTRPPVPPFDEASARQKVLAAEAAWNTRDPERVAGAYTIDSVWRNRSAFVEGRDQIITFLRSKWQRELDYALRKDLWAFHDNRIAVRFQYEVARHRQRVVLVLRERELGVRRAGPHDLTVGALWRYPVKTLAGECLDTAEITTNGIAGDRVVHVRGPEGVRTSRRHHNLLGLLATLGSDGEPLVDGRPWNSPEILERVRAVAGTDATLARYDGPDRFDVLPLLVATDDPVQLVRPTD